MVTVKAAAPPRLSRSPRVSVELSSPFVGSATGDPSFRLDSLPECSSCEPFDEAVEKHVVEQRQRDGRDEYRSHERLPKEDIAADQVVRNSGRDGALLRTRDKGEGVDELVD